jgi:hypothetical protein
MTTKRKGLKLQFISSEKLAKRFCKRLLVGFFGFSGFFKGCFKKKIEFFSDGGNYYHSNDCYITLDGC